MEKPKPLAKIRNRHGILQDQIKFRITDGRWVFTEGTYSVYTTLSCYTQTQLHYVLMCSKYVKVTFWDEFAVRFSKALKPNLECPIIIVIGSVRVQEWKGNYKF